MTALRVFLSRLRDRFGRGKAARRRGDDLDEDIRTHLELLTADYERRGLSPEAARDAARRDFGGVTQVREAWHDERSYALIENALRDVRQGARLLRRQPAAALGSILSLGIAIAGATSVYAVLDAVFYQALPVTRPHELVIVQPQLNNRRWILPNPIFERLRRNQQSLTDLAAVNDVQFLRARLDDGPAVYVQASLVSGSYFSVLGLTPEIGRLLTTGDDETADASTCAAVLGHGYWTRQFHADPNVLGRHLRARAADCLIVGVAPKAFTSHLAGYDPDLWLPLRPLTTRRDLDNYFGAFFSGVIGRLKPEVSAEQATAELTGAYQRIHLDVPRARNEKPIDPATVRIRLADGASGLNTLRSQFGLALTILMSLVVIVMLIAGVNVANLTLARGLVRRQELATRRALGASNARLLGHLFAEGGVIVAAGALVGVVLAAMTAPLIASFITLDYQTIAIAPAPTIRLALFVSGVSVLLLFVVAGLPAYHLVRSGTARPTPVRWASDSPSAQRALRSLVVIQLSLALLLVAACGLLMQTRMRLSQVDPGFEADRVVIFNLGGSSRFEPATEEVRAARAASYRDLEARLDAIPGVESAALSWLGLFGGSDLWIPIRYQGQTQPRASVRVDYVTPRYFDVVGMRVTRGRAFRDDDRATGVRPVVINEAMARARFGGDAIGREFALDTAADSGAPFSVVGVIADSKYNDVRETAAEPMMWLPLSEIGGVSMRYVNVRARPGAIDSVTAGVRQVLSAADPDLLVRQTTTLSTSMNGTQLRERLLFGLSMAFGGIAVLLAALGLYGTLSQALARRRRELGVRLALGARPETLRRMVLIDALRLVCIAIAIALPAALLTARVLRAFLFGVEPTDPATLTASAAFVVLVTLATAYLPARRAASVNPVEVTRAE